MNFFIYNIFRNDSHKSFWSYRPPLIFFLLNDDMWPQHKWPMRLALWFLSGFRSRPHNFMGVVYIIHPAEHTEPSLVIPIMQLWKYQHSLKAQFLFADSISGSSNKSERTKTISSIRLVLGQVVFLIDSKWIKWTPRCHCFDTALLCSFSSIYDSYYPITKRHQLCSKIWELLCYISSSTFSDSILNVMSKFLIQQHDVTKSIWYNSLQFLKMLSR